MFVYKHEKNRKNKIKTKSTKKPKLSTEYCYLIQQQTAGSKSPNKYF